ncbi:hypothetical protein [Streptomyces sp. SLBN-115]|uniref:hypothetical protein n=1 Tax=Streptomyces sp. SLBN-115 TaxID=2768453 RepID=UPI001F38BDB0|nr:hypothetical protein [Streptomyces sp. SLBN-115]
MAEKRRTPGIEGSRPLGSSATPTTPWHTPPTWRRPCRPHQSRTRPEALPGHRRLEPFCTKGLRPASTSPAGYEGGKQEISETVDFLRSPEHYAIAGAKGPVE